MELKMYINGQMIDSMTLIEKSFYSHQDIKRAQYELEERNTDIIEAEKEDPQFFLDHVPSGMNRKRYIN